MTNPLMCASQMNWSQFRKSTFASCAPRPSSSSHYQQFSNELQEIASAAQTEVSEPYKLSQITSRETLDHCSGCSNVKVWIHQRLNSDCNILINQSMKPSEVGLNQLFLTKTKRPDVAIYDDNEIISVQIEVESNDDRLTTTKCIRKLSYGLMDQLRWQKNRDRTICSCTGFIFLQKEKMNMVSN